MPTPFIMPKMDMDQETVHIDEWLKKEGDLVTKGEPVVVIETDKITSEVEAPATGKLTHLLYGENVDVPVTKVIAYILAEGETEADLPEMDKPAAEAEEKPVEEVATVAKGSKSATPVAKRMMEENNLSLEDVPASGEKITKEDVEAYLDGLNAVKSRVQTPATPAARRIASENRIEINQISGSGPLGRVQASDVEKFLNQTMPPVPSGAGESLEFNTMRQRIADRLTASYQNTPHIYLTVEVDMQEAVASRKRLNALKTDDSAKDISLTAYLVKAVAWSLKRHPYLNSALEEGNITLWDEINIGVATALDEGLIVPVIRNADQLSLYEVNASLRDLTKRARLGELNREEVKNGTFTISNLGMYGIHSFTAIINPPQSAILAVGTVNRRPVVVDDNDHIEVHPMVFLTLSVDHRIIDGAVGAMFLSDLVKALETPELLML